MEIQKECSDYDGSEMDEIKSPPLIMIVVFMGLIGLAFLYVFLWSILLTP